MEKRQQVFKLWLACFEDTEEFVQFYFDRKYKDENALIYEENGNAVAALQMIPYPMTWAGTTLNASYISGACTLPMARNKGIMTQLLSEAFRQMAQREIPLSFLIPAEPWLYEYYRKTGYATVFEHSIENSPLSSTPFAPNVTIIRPECYNDLLPSEYYTYFSRKMSERPCCIQHPLDDFTTILQDLYMSGGWLLIAQQANKTVGLAIVIPLEKEIRVNEILYDNEDIRQALLAKASEIGQNPVVTYKSPATRGNTIRSGMIRIIDAQQILANYARHYPHQSFTLRLTDHQLPQNNGCYILENGNCRKINDPKTENFNLDIATLAEIMFGRSPETSFPVQHPYMSLMLD